MSVNSLPSEDGKKSGVSCEENTAANSISNPWIGKSFCFEKQDLADEEKRFVAEHLFDIQWISSDEGFMECAGMAKHTGPNSTTDCKIYLGGDLPPTITCFHSSCADEIAAANRTLRSELGKASLRAGKPIPRRIEPTALGQSAVLAPKTQLQPLALPPPLGTPLRTQVETCFNVGEQVSWQATRSDGKTPQGAGQTSDRDWLASQNESSLNQDGHGLYVRVNPMSEKDGSKATQVSDYRHCLLEFDDAPLELQWAAIQASRLPISSVVYSGEKSLHCLVKVDAGEDHDEFRRRAGLAKQAVERFVGIKADKTLDAARLTRLAGGVRCGKVQTLIAVNIGAASWKEWEATQLAHDKNRASETAIEEYSLGAQPFPASSSKRVNMSVVYRWLVRHPFWNGRIWFDSFRNRIRTNYQGYEQDWNDQATLYVLHWMQREADLMGCEKSHVIDAVQSLSRDVKRNCLQEWLTSLQWNGVERLPDFIHLAFGATQNAYTEAVGRCFIVSMVARAMKPGCKVDTMPVFEGAQGAGKSSALKILGGEFFSESLEDMGNKDFYLSLDGRWLMEIPELQSMTKVEVERIKAVLSRQIDSFRAPYGRCLEEHPRQVVFAGTTNRDDWHQDDTGGRRFLPIRCGNMNLEWLRENRDQLFAEAMVRLNRGESWWDYPTHLAAEEVAERHPDDPWEDELRNFLTAGKRYTTKELLARIGIMTEQQTMVHSRRVATVMRRLGWKQSSVKTEAGTKQKMWLQS